MKTLLLVSVLFLFNACSGVHDVRNTKSDATPQWAASGPGFVCPGFDYEWDMNSTHAWLVQQGFAIMENDGQDRNLGDTYLNFAKHKNEIAKYANAPDVDDTNACSFSSHFYTPSNNQNYLADGPNAKDQFQVNLKKARSAYLSRQLSGKFTTFVRKYMVPKSKDWIVTLGKVLFGQYDNLLEKKSETIPEGPYYLGKAIHFMTDTCNPHHANNVTALDDSPAVKHMDFEAMINDNEQKWAVSSLGVTWPNPLKFDKLETDSLAIMKKCSDYAHYNYDALMNPATRVATTQQIMTENQRATALLLNRFLVSVDPKSLTPYQMLEERKQTIAWLENEANQKEKAVFEDLARDLQSDSDNQIAIAVADLQKKSTAVALKKDLYLKSLGLETKAQ